MRDTTFFMEKAHGKTDQAEDVILLQNPNDEFRVHDPVHFDIPKFSTFVQTPGTTDSGTMIPSLDDGFPASPLSTSAGNKTANFLAGGAAAASTTTTTTPTSAQHLLALHDPTAASFYGISPESSTSTSTSTSPSGSHRNSLDDTQQQQPPQQQQQPSSSVVASVPPGFIAPQQLQIIRDRSMGVEESKRMAALQQQQQQQPVVPVAGEKTKTPLAVLQSGALFKHRPIPPQFDFIRPTRKSLFVFRGLPGSGKSFLAQYLAYRAASGDGSDDDGNGEGSGGLSTTICSADHYFVDSTTGEYKFEGSKIGRAHAACLSAVIQSFADGIECIIIDNTNSCCWEYQNYLSLAAVFGYTTQVLEMFCRDDQTLAAFHHRTLHSVPMSASLAMRRRWEHDASVMLIEPAYDDGSHPNDLPSSSASSLISTTTTTTLTDSSPSTTTTTATPATAKTSPQHDMQQQQQYQHHSGSGGSRKKGGKRGSKDGKQQQQQLQHMQQEHFKQLQHMHQHQRGGGSPQQQKQHYHHQQQHHHHQQQHQQQQQSYLPSHHQSSPPSYIHNSRHNNNNNNHNNHNNDNNHHSQQQHHHHQQQRHQQQQHLPLQFRHARAEHNAAILQTGLPFVRSNPRAWSTPSSTASSAASASLLTSSLLASLTSDGGTSSGIW